MGEQGHDDHDRLCQSAQPIEDGAFASAEGFVTRMTDEAPLLLRMDTNIALAGLASSRAMPVGAACGCRVHDSPPGFVWKQAKRSMLPPHFRYKCASPRLSAELPQGYPPYQIAVFVGTDQSEETAPCFDSTLHSDIPTVYGVGLPHALSAFGPTVTSRYQHHHSVRSPVLDQL